MKTLWLKITLGLALFLLLGIFLTPTSAQAPPDDVINPILGDLSQRVGRQVAIADLANYSWQTGIFNNEGIGCPSPDIEYTRSFVQGYIVTIYYGNLYWDYRYDAGKGTFFLCNTPDLTRLVLPVTQTPRPTQTATIAPTLPAPTAAVVTQPTALPQATLAQPTVAPATNTTGSTTLVQPTANAAGATTLVQPTTASNATTGTGELPCPTALTGSVPTRLSVGLTGTFVGASGQNIHAEPNRTSAVIGTTTIGGTFSILDGPACDRTFTWWQIDTSGVIGWVGEVNPSDFSYWLEPAANAAAPAGTTPSTNTTTAPAIEVQTIEELARQAVLSPQLMLTSATPLNPEGVVIIGTANGLVMYSNNNPNEPLGNISEVPALEAVIAGGGQGVIAIEPASGGDFPYGLGFHSTTGGGGSGGSLDAAYASGLVLLDELNLIALGSENGVQLYDLGTNQVVADLPLETQPLKLVKNPANNQLAILLADQVRLVDVSTRTEVGRLVVTASADGAYGLAFSPDGSQLAVSNGGNVAIYALSTSQEAFQLPAYSGDGGQVAHIAYSPDGRWIATAGIVAANSTDVAKIQLWDAKTGDLLATMGGVAGDQTVIAIGFDPSSSLLNAVSREDLWQIWGLTQ